MKKKRKSSPRTNQLVPFTRAHSDKVRYSKKELRRLAKKEREKLDEG